MCKSVVTAEQLSWKFMWSCSPWDLQSLRWAPGEDLPLSSRMGKSACNESESSPPRRQISYSLSVCQASSLWPCGLKPARLLSSMGFSRQEYLGCHWKGSGLLFPSSGDLHVPGIEPRSPALQANSLPSEPPGKPTSTIIIRLHVTLSNQTPNPCWSRQ